MNFKMFAMLLDCISTALEELQELAENSIQLIPSDPHSPPKIPPWDLPETDL